jgi:hypothetical protein
MVCRKVSKMQVSKNAGGFLTQSDAATKSATSRNAGPQKDALVRCQGYLTRCRVVPGLATPSLSDGVNTYRWQPTAHIRGGRWAHKLKHAQR